MAGETDKAKLQTLSDAAEAYAKARADERRAKASERGAGADGSDLVISFGRAKGQRVGEADDENLEWLARALAENIADESKARWRRENQKMRSAIVEELKRRGIQVED